MPAHTTSGSAGEGAIAHTASRVRPVSAGKEIAPSGPFSQVLPRSSECSTWGPQCQCLLAMNSRGSPPRVSTATACTSLRSSSGPRTSQLSRFSSAVATQAPLRVPIIRTVRAMRRSSSQLAAAASPTVLAQ